MTPEQTAVCAETVSGRRGKVPTPMIAWLQNPELARRGQGLGEVLRFGTSLSPAQSELAILVCARHWNCGHVWRSHARHALAAGIDEDTLGKLADGDVDAGLGDMERLVVEIATKLLATHRIEDGLYRRAIADLGEAGLVELVALVGYYGLVALTVNAFELGSGS